MPKVQGWSTLLLLTAGCAGAPSSDAAKPFIDGSYESETDSKTSLFTFDADSERYTWWQSPCAAGQACSDDGTFTFDPDTQTLELKSSAGGQLQMTLDGLKTAPSASSGGLLTKTANTSFDAPRDLHPLEDFVERSQHLLDRTQVEIVIQFDADCPPGQRAVLQINGVRQSCGASFSQTTSPPPRPAPPPLPLPPP